MRCSFGAPWNKTVDTGPWLARECRVWKQYKWKEIAVLFGNEHSHPLFADARRAGSTKTRRRKEVLLKREMRGTTISMPSMPGISGMPMNSGQAGPSHPGRHPDSSSRHYFVPETSTSTRRSGCRQAISFGLAFVPLHSPGLVTGSEPSAPLAATLPDGIPADSTR
jgi:hypothetical protein